MVCRFGTERMQSMEYTEYSTYGDAQLEESNPTIYSSLAALLSFVSLFIAFDLYSVLRNSFCFSYPVLRLWTSAWTMR